MPGSVVATPRGAVASSRLRSLLLLAKGGVLALEGAFFRLVGLDGWAPFFRPWSASSFDVESFWTTFSVFLNPTLESEWFDAKGIDDFGLFGDAVDVELADNHLKRCGVIHFVGEYWHHPIEVGDLPVLTLIANIRGDQVSAFMEDGQLKLWHVSHLTRIGYHVAIPGIGIVFSAPSDFLPHPIP
jgi:hypothetical protein